MNLKLILLPMVLVATGCGPKSNDASTVAFANTLGSGSANTFVCPKRVTLSGFRTKGSTQLKADIKAANVFDDELAADLARGLAAKHAYDQLGTTHSIELSPVDNRPFPNEETCDFSYKGESGHLFLDTFRQINVTINGGVPADVDGELRAASGKNLQKKPLTIFMSLNFPTGGQAPIVNIGTIDRIDIE